MSDDSSADDSTSAAMAPLPLPASVVAAFPAFRPRVWPAILVGIAILPLVFVIQVMVMGACLMFSGAPTQNSQQWLMDFIITPKGFLIIGFASQLPILLLALSAGAISPQPLMMRLGLVKGHAPVWLWVVLMFATPLVGWLGAQLIPESPPDSDGQLQMLNTMFTNVTGWAAVAVIAFVTIMPSLSEELLFRGFIQRRLQQRWPAILAIATSTLFFAIVHMDPTHVLAVIPLGLWLGYLTWASGSLFPAMLCHFTNNAIASISPKLMPAAAPDAAAITGPNLVIVAMSLAPCAAALVAGVWLLHHYRKQALQAAEATQQVTCQ